jgi:ferrous iron transport protein A
MTLAEVLPNGTCRIISAAEENREFQSRLYALGMYPGVRVEVLHVAPLGDPLQVKVGHTLLSIRKQEAGMIRVESVEAAS